jgi:hypothetical protein
MPTIPGKERNAPHNLGDYGLARKWDNRGGAAEGSIWAPE